MSERTALYRFFDGAGVLLYVGITKCPPARFAAHANEKPGWPEIARIEIEWCDTRCEAEIREKAAIRSERPRWNIVHTHVPAVPRRRVPPPELSDEEIRDLEAFLADPSQLNHLDPAAHAVEIGRRLNQLPAYQSLLSQIRHSAVLKLRARGMSHAEIAEELGISRARAANIAQGLS